PSRRARATRRTRRDARQRRRRGPLRSWYRRAGTTCSSPGPRSAGYSSTTALRSSLAPSTRIGLSRRRDEARADNVGDRQRLDAGHLTEPHLLATGKVRGLDGAFVIRDLLQRSDFEQVCRPRRAADIGLDRVVDLFRLVRLDPLRRAPQRGDE